MDSAYAEWSVIGGLKIGATNCGRSTLLDRMRSARSSPQTCVGVGVTTLDTPMKWPFIAMTASVVTKMSLVAKSAPNIAVEQSITVEEIDAAQWRAVATRFGARSAPEQKATPEGVITTSPTADEWVVSSVPP